MNAAFSLWEGRIAPVFDVAPETAIVSRKDRAKRSERVSLPCSDPVQSVAAFQKHCVSTLICGAISRPLQDFFTACGVTVHAFVTGTFEEVVKAWRDSTLNDTRFLMPGCGRGFGQGRVSGGRRNRNGRTESFGRKGFGGINFGNERTAPFENSATLQRTMCRCPRCGHEIVHVPGMPYSKCRCPNCYAPMVRA